MDGIGKRTGMQILRKVLLYLRYRKDCRAFMVEAGAECGIPEILCCCKGRFFALTVKAAGEEASPIQSAQMETIRRTGGTAVVVRSVSDVTRILERAGGEAEK